MTEKRFKNLTGEQLVSNAAVFVCHEHLGLALEISPPCGCGDPECGNRDGGIAWSGYYGLQHGIQLRAFEIHGDTHTDRVKFIETMDSDIRKAIGEHVYKGVTYHLIGEEGPPDPTQFNDVLERTTPPVAKRWSDLVRFYYTWCEVNDARQN